MRHPAGPDARRRPVRWWAADRHAADAAYDGTYVFTNDFAALLPDSPSGTFGDASGLLRAESCRGTCRVVCFSPRHDRSIAVMDAASVRAIVDEWCRQFAELAQRWTYVQIFENKGAAMGCSNPHPHGQIWACDVVPEEVAVEAASFAAYRDRAPSRNLLVDYVQLELSLGIRVVCANDHFVAVVPFWAYWPYETLVLPRRHVARLTDLSDAERTELAELLRELTCRYDNLFRCSFPYSMGVHQAPGYLDTADAAAHAGADGQHADPFGLHLHYYPPLLRSATVKFVCCACAQPRSALRRRARRRLTSSRAVAESFTSATRCLPICAVTSRPSRQPRCCASAAPCTIYSAQSSVAPTAAAA